MAATSFTSLKEQFQLFVQASSEKARDDLRSQFVVDCGKYYEQIHPGHKSCLFDAHFIDRAIDVNNRLIFTDFPGSFNRLKPLAKSYIRNWESLTLYFSLSQETALDTVLASKTDALVQTHKAFVRQFIEEAKVVARYTPSGAQMNFPNTIKLFYQTVMGHFVSDLSSLSIAEEMFALVDPKLFDIIPYCAVVSLLKQEGEFPEFFAPLESKLQSLKLAYASLQKPEQILLSKAVFSESDQGSLTIEGKKLFKGICEFIYESRKGNDEKSSFAAINNALFKFIDTDLEIVKSLRNYPNLVLVSSSPEEIVDFLYELPESDYAQFRTAFDLLPEQHKLLHMPLSEIAERRNFYRIQAIVELAQALSD